MAVATATAIATAIAIAIAIAVVIAIANHIARFDEHFVKRSPDASWNESNVVTGAMCAGR
ncbi:hypothetical protein [Burkholderia pseudomallei]|uniref:hypothetical protein n=1 Tax=Burkholderia pseudomallei TaxID=28450 RepID=UPI000678E959|nr:hypothetical protein [Burkholderia pseudomallei]